MQFGSLHENEIKLSVDDFSTVVQMYSSDEEYRAFLRRLMQMDPTKFYETEDIKCDPTDPKVSSETIDEYNYDCNAVNVYLDGVYKTTKDHPQFQRLYLAAAALMFSVDPEIGLAVLMSYDYLAWFHSSYNAFLSNPSEFTENEEYYSKLIKRIETK
jgi:hypothetical protein